jgi:hypothetical protein
VVHGHPVSHGIAPNVNLYSIIRQNAADLVGQRGQGYRPTGNSRVGLSLALHRLGCGAVTVSFGGQVCRGRLQCRPEADLKVGATRIGATSPIENVEPELQHVEPEPRFRRTGL